jgi:ribonuclease I
MNVHETTIHGRCPINAQWDYYTLRVETEEFIRAEDIEEMCDFVRGKSMPQEQIAAELRATLPAHCRIELRGRHGQNCQTTVTL